ncbi:MAG: hypothetical protein P1R74_12015 [Sedimenticola sp.]|nr:hypothetical protein [Sedimenticola sp.]
MKKAPLSLHLVIPGLLGPMPALRQSDTDLQLPNLQRLLARSQQTLFPGKDLESVLFKHFGIHADEQSNLPTAAYRRIGDGAIPDDRYWLQLSPVYLRPDQDRLLLFDVEDLAFTAAEAEGFAELFNAHFAEEGWSVEVVTPQRWYLPLDTAPKLKCHELTDAFGRNMDLFLPEGDEGIKWHGVLNEIQMLFYTSTVNEQRESEGKGPISGLWISGGGRLVNKLTTSRSALYGSDPLLKGLAKMTHLPVDDRPVDANALCQLSGDVLVHYDGLQRSVLCADPFAWQQELAELEAWITPLVEAIKRGQVEKLTLYACNGHRYLINKAELRRFWKRSRPILQRLESNS